MFDRAISIAHLVAIQEIQLHAPYIGLVRYRLGMQFDDDRLANLRGAGDSVLLTSCHMRRDRRDPV